MEYPFLDSALAEQFFSATSEAEIADLRALVRELETDIPPRFAALHQQCVAAEADGVAAQRELHGLRGGVANFALARAAEQLRVLEIGWSGFPPAERSTLLRGAEGDVQAGLIGRL